MAVRFTPCPACARHVKEGDGACPFCGASVARSLAPPVVLGRMSRAALLAASAAGALALADCSSSSGTPLYGGSSPPQEAGGPTNDGSSPDGVGSIMPLYGSSSGIGLGSSGSSSGSESSGESSGDAADAAATTPLDASEAGDAATAGDDGGHMAQPLYGGIAPAYGLTPRPN